MITVYFIRGEEKIPVQVDEGMTLMEAARDYANQSIEEIPADCSGCCACATCHVIIDRNWLLFSSLRDSWPFFYHWFYHFSALTQF